MIIILIFDGYYNICYYFLFLLYVYIYLHKPSQKKNHFDPETSANFSGTEGPFLGFEPNSQETDLMKHLGDARQVLADLQEASWLLVTRHVYGCFKTMAGGFTCFNMF